MTSSTNTNWAPRDTFSRRYYFTESRKTKTDLMDDMSPFLTEEGKVAIVDKVDRLLQEVYQSTSADEQGFLFTKQGNRLTIEWSKGLVDSRSVSFSIDGATVEGEGGQMPLSEPKSDGPRDNSDTQSESLSAAQASTEIPLETVQDRMSRANLLSSVDPADTAQ